MVPLNSTKSELMRGEHFFENEAVAGKKPYWTGKGIPKSLIVLILKSKKIPIQMTQYILQYFGDETFAYPSSACFSQPAIYELIVAVVCFFFLANLYK